MMKRPASRWICWPSESPVLVHRVVSAGRKVKPWEDRHDENPIDVNGRGSPFRIHECVGPGTSSSPGSGASSGPGAIGHASSPGASSGYGSAEGRGEEGQEG